MMTMLNNILISWKGGIEYIHAVKVYGLVCINTNNKSPIIYLIKHAIHVPLNDGIHFVPCSCIKNIDFMFIWMAGWEAVMTSAI